MARGKCTFKQSDATKAMKSAIAAGLRIERVEIDRDGKIVLQIAQVEQNRMEPGTGWEDVG